MERDGSMSIFKRKRRNRQGELIEDKSYTVEFVDHNNITRRLPAYRFKAAAEELKRNLEILVSLRASGAGFDLQLNRFIENLSPSIRDKLASWRIIDSERAAGGKPLTDHLADWQAAMQAEELSIEHIKKSIARINRLKTDCHWHYLSDITADSFDNWRVGVRKGELSLQTANHYLTTAKTLCNWLVKNKRLTENPLAHLSKRIVTDLDRRHVRRASDDTELETLLTATVAGGVHHGLTGWERALLYRLGFETGFRWSECRSLIKANFNFTPDQPTVTVTSGRAKNRKERTNPISKELAADLKEHMALFLPNAKVFPNMVKGRVGSKMLQADLKAAGIPYRDECGQVRDFHSLRQTCGTRLARNGVPLTVAQRLLDHSDPKLTANHYTMVMLKDKAAAVAKLPVLTGKTIPDDENLSKTGTTDNHPFEYPPLSFSVTAPVKVGGDILPPVKGVDRLGDSNAPDFDGFHWTYKDGGEASSRRKVGS